MHTLLTRSDFESAVKDALRHYTRTDLLTGNALLHAQLLTQSDLDTAAPSALRRLMAESAESLFANERDRRLYRVLDLTYFNPAPKQEAAAERLGMSFSTYRRQLATAVGRLTDWLWQHEQHGRETAPAVGQTPGPAADAAELGSPAARPRLSLVILPFLNLSGEASADYLVDGLVDTLITDLASWLPGSFVISRSTAFTYKGRSVPIRQVGRELGVRYAIGAVWGVVGIEGGVVSGV
jgi:hypothetical protein